MLLLLALVIIIIGNIIKFKSCKEMPSNIIMHNQILKKLPQIEQTHQIKLLYVAESGSRAWGFASTDSDYDVRGIFIRPRNAYLSIDKPKETFEWIENNWFDVGAWDITKALHLLRKSNAIYLSGYNHLLFINNMLVSKKNYLSWHNYIINPKSLFIIIEGSQKPLVDIILKRVMQVKR